MSAVFGALFLIGGTFLYSALNQIPTCSDGKQNQNEEGVDCGGVCNRACVDQVVAPITLWSRSIEVSKGVYDAIAFVENPNPKTGVSSVAYKFKLYDSENILVVERAGKTFINPNERLYIFESNIKTGERVPKRAFFEFQSGPNWQKTDNKKPLISVKNQRFIEEEGSLKVDIVNSLFFELKDVVVTAILIDEDGNVFASSEALVKSLPGDGVQEIFFTWPAPFEKRPAKIEVIPRINVFELDS